MVQPLAGKRKETPKVAGVQSHFVSLGEKRSLRPIDTSDEFDWPHDPQAKRPMIEADSGGSNGTHSRRYKKPANLGLT